MGKIVKSKHNTIKRKKRIKLDPKSWYIISLNNQFSIDLIRSDAVANVP